MLNNIKPKIGLVGLGNIGASLLRLLLKNGFEIIAHTKNLSILDSLSNRYNSYISSGLLLLSNDLNTLKDADIVIEAISEDVNLKKNLFGQLSEILSNDCILCSNTSSLSILQLSEYIKNPSRFVGLHFFNPPTLLNVVEIIKHSTIAEATLNYVSEFVKIINFQSITLQDSAGFLVNRLLFSLIVQAIRYYEENTAISPESIDNMMTVACNFKMGPLKTADLIGLDTCLTILRNLKERTIGDTYNPPGLLQEYVANGYLGKKSGRGFYEYA